MASHGTAQQRRSGATIAGQPAKYAKKVFRSAVVVACRWCSVQRGYDRQRDGSSLAILARLVRAALSLGARIAAPTSQRKLGNVPKRPKSREDQLLADLIGLREHYHHTCGVLVVRALAVGMAPDTVRRIVRKSILEGVDPNALELAKTALEMAEAIASRQKEPS